MDNKIDFKKISYEEIVKIVEAGRNELKERCNALGVSTSDNWKGENNGKQD